MVLVIMLKLIAGFAVIGAIRINMSQLTPQRVEQGGQHLGIMDIFQRDFRRHDVVGHQVYRQVQLALDSPLLLAVFSDLLIAFTKHLQASRVDNQVGDAPLAGLPIGHYHRAGPFADTTVIGGTKWYVHQLEQGVE